MSTMTEIPFKFNDEWYTLRIGGRPIGVEDRYMCRIDDDNDMLVVNCYWKDEYAKMPLKKSYELMDMGPWHVDPIFGMKEVVYILLCDWSIYGGRKVENNEF